MNARLLTVPLVALVALGLGACGRQAQHGQRAQSEQPVSQKMTPAQTAVKLGNDGDGARGHVYDLSDYQWYLNGKRGAKFQYNGMSAYKDPDFMKVYDEESRAISKRVHRPVAVKLVDGTKTVGTKTIQ